MLRNTGKEGGVLAKLLRELEFDFNASLFVVSFSLCSISSSSPFKGATLTWKEYHITLLVCFCVCLFNVHLLYDHFCAGSETEAIAVGLLRCHMAIKKLRCCK